MTEIVGVGILSFALGWISRGVVARRHLVSLREEWRSRVLAEFDRVGYPVQNFDRSEDRGVPLTAPVLRNGDTKEPITSNSTHNEEEE